MLNPTQKQKLKLKLELNLAKIQIINSGLVQGCPALGAYVPNTGCNWYSCYKCEYDLCAACVKRRVERNTMVCYLCMDRVPMDKWRSGKHRHDCSWKYSKLLSSLPECQATCVSCSHTLKVWMAGQNLFTCKHPRHKHWAQQDK